MGLTDEETVRDFLAECPMHVREALEMVVERSERLAGALLRVNELEASLDAVEQMTRRALDSRHKCEICGYSDGTVKYRGWHEDGNAMMTCKSCGDPPPPKIIGI